MRNLVAAIIVVIFVSVGLAVCRAYGGGSNQLKQLSLSMQTYHSSEPAGGLLIGEFADRFDADDQDPDDAYWMFLGLEILGEDDFMLFYEYMLEDGVRP